MVRNVHAHAIACEGVEKRRRKRVRRPWSFPRLQHNTRIVGAPFTIVPAEVTFHDWLTSDVLHFTTVAAGLPLRGKRGSDG